MILECCFPQYQFLNFLWSITHCLWYEPLKYFFDWSSHFNTLFIFSQSSLQYSSLFVWNVQLNCSVFLQKYPHFLKIPACLSFQSFQILQMNQLHRSPSKLVFQKTNWYSRQWRNNSGLGHFPRVYNCHWNNFVVLNDWIFFCFFLYITFELYDV